MGLRDMPPRGGSGAPRLRGWRGLLSAAFRACHALVPAFPPRASGATGGLLLAVLLAALPLQAVAQTQGVKISVSPDAGGQYPSIDEGGTFKVTLRRTGDNSNALTVQYATRDGGGPEQFVGNAQAGTDYTGISGSHTFPAENSDDHTFEVETKEDTNYEPWEYFTITVSGSYQDEGSPVSIVSQTKELRINEDDERYLTLSPVSDSAIGSSNPEFMAKEGGTGNENQLTISLNEPLPYDLDIKYTVGDDPYTTATSRDFTMTGTQTATIPEADKMAVTIDIRITDDQLVEPTEYFTLDFGAIAKENDPGNAKGTFNTVNFQESKLTSQPLSVSIMDNDTASTGGVVHLRGEGPSGPGVIDKFPKHEEDSYRRP